MKKENDNIVMWIFFTLLFGLLPLLFLLLSCLINGWMISLQSISSEMFFLTIVLCADILKTLYSANGKRIMKRKTLIYGVSIFILVIASVLYGAIIIVETRNINEIVYILSLNLCMFSVMLGFLTQVIINKDQKDDI